MKTIWMHQLKPGDIFCYRLKLRNREAFKVIEAKTDCENPYLICKSRNCNDPNKTIRKQIKGHVILLKRDK